jgi:hypothetical protein
MADDYIDYLECLEYGEFFTSEVKKLLGKTNLVDIAALGAHVTSAMQSVATELEKQGVNRSGVRIDRKDVEAKTVAMRKALEKFYHHLGSLDDDAGVDIDAFFAGGNLGGLAALKPADVVQRAAEVARGFAANTSLPEGAKWKTRLEDAQSALVGALSGKGASTGTSIQGTTALIAARQDFLLAYNGVAKKLIAGVLTSLGRKDELRLYFKDLQVNESSRAKLTTEEPTTAPANGTTTLPSGG